MSPTLTNSSGSTWTISSDDFTSNGSISNPIRISDGALTRAARSAARSASNGCNESKKFDNDEKALYHGLKSAFRMSREYDGSEYGSANPQYETAARIAGHVATAYLVATDQAFTRAASHRYVRDRFYERSWFKFTPAFGAAEFSAAVDHAWTQIDSKRNHYDAARTALAAAEAFVDEAISPAPPAGDAE